MQSIVTIDMEPSFTYLAANFGYLPVARIVDHHSPPFFQHSSTKAKAARANWLQFFAEPLLRRNESLHTMLSSGLPCRERNEEFD